MHKIKLVQKNHFNSSKVRELVHSVCLVQRVNVAKSVYGRMNSQNVFLLAFILRHTYNMHTSFYISFQLETDLLTKEFKDITTYIHTKRRTQFSSGTEITQ